MIETKDSLEYLRSKADFEFDMNYSDPPYALGSEVIIRPDGKVDYKKANDFMNKWEMPTGAYWEQWFKEAYRTLKHGGYLVMFGIDRQLLLFKYYANLAGFTEQQSLYWYFISNFPKATDLSKQIDKNAGAERNVIGLKKGVGSNKTDSMKNGLSESQEFNTEYDETTPSTDLAKKYEGYKYSISPLKQTNETIMVFQKPYKTKSCLHDTLAYENGDDNCCCGAFDIDGNRVDFQSEEDKKSTKVGFADGSTDKDHSNIGKGLRASPLITNNGFSISGNEGRYPSQTFCSRETAEVLGDCSKILHKCDFEENEHDLYFYNPKVSKSERNAGCDEFDEKETLTGLDNRGRVLEREDGTKTLVDRFSKTPQKNTHPTLKPIKLNERILKLFKTPNEQKIIYPFAGSGSEVIGGIKAGFTNWCGCELNQEYVDIAEARIKYWINN